MIITYLFVATDDKIFWAHAALSSSNPKFCKACFLTHDLAILRANSDKSAVKAVPFWTAAKLSFIKQVLNADFWSNDNVSGFCSVWQAVKHSMVKAINKYFFIWGPFRLNGFCSSANMANSVSMACCFADFVTPILQAANKKCKVLFYWNIR